MNEIRLLAAEVGVIPRTAPAFSPEVRRRCSPLPRLQRSNPSRTLTPSGRKRKSASCTTITSRPIPGEARGSRSTNRREFGHGALAEKALEPMIPTKEAFPYAIRLVRGFVLQRQHLLRQHLAAAPSRLWTRVRPLRRLSRAFPAA